MKIKNIDKSFLFFMSLILLLQTLSCSQQSKNIKKFGANADYFFGLKLLEQNKEKEAIIKLKKCVKKGDKLFALKSAKKLCELGSVQEKTNAAIYLANNFYDDKASLLTAVKQFEKAGENSLILEYTQNLDFKNEQNELIKIRLSALKQLESPNYEKETFKWFTERPVSKEHYQFYRDIYNHPDFVNFSDDFNNNPDPYTEIDFENQTEFINQFVLDFRIELYKRNYTYVYSQAQNLINLLKNGKLQPNEQIASDIGKTFLYASSDLKKDAENLIQLADEFKTSCMEFYFWFYTGRLYAKTNVYYEQAKNSFEKAVNIADSSNKKDNALWYLLTTMLDFSVDELVKNIDFYAKQFNESEYFDDFFDSLSVTLLSLKKWSSFQTVYEKIDGYATKESTAKFAYIFARLIQENIVPGSNMNNVQFEKALKKACDSGSSNYYKILAAYQLGLQNQELENLLFSPVKNLSENDNSNSENFKQSKDAALLMEGYVYFGFPQMIYPEWQELFKILPEKTNFYTADFLHNCGKTDDTNTFYTQSLRIAAKTYNYSTEKLTEKEMSLVFPKCYSQYVEKYSNEYMIPPNIMYALIRSESFFDPNIKSAAGAIGLTQLMEFTANDVARKLKISDYSLTDVDMNIKIGTFYLAELLQRCDNSFLKAFFSYNAGITRVRRWLKSSLTEYNKKDNLPMDLFLETLPYSETREYGRKLVSAAVMYDYLDNPQNFCNTVTTLLKN